MEWEREVMFGGMVEETGKEAIRKGCKEFRTRRIHEEGKERMKEVKEEI